ncbi:hypothetical protein ACEPAG_102 [Sanghuangporus baumii]
MQSEGVAIGKDALRLISEAVLNIQHGTVSDHEMWSSTEDCIESMRLPMHYEHLKPALKNALDFLKSIETAKKVLDDMARSAGQDTLVDIFIFVVDGHDPLRKNLPEVALSSVCKRFRSLVLNEPRLWSRLTSEMSHSNIMRHLDLCKDAPLTVIIQESSWSAQLCSFIHAVKPQASRWKSFHFVEDDFNYSGSFAENMEKHFGNMVLPKLKTFQVLDCGTGELEGFRTFQTWNMPQICHISFENVPFPTNTNLFVPTVITSLNIRWATRGNCEMLDHLGFLSSMPNLNDLQFCFLLTLDWESKPDSIPSHIRLPRVRSFRLEVNIPQLFWSLMDSLDTPVLHKLCLDLHDYRGRSPDRWLDRYSAIHASVKELDFAFEFNQAWHSHHELSKLFQKFPGLELLNLNSLGSKIDINLRNVDRMPPLRSIVLPSTCPYYFLNGLADALKKYGRGPGFENVQVSTESLGGNEEKFLTKNKVKSYDRNQYPSETVEHPYFYDFPNLIDRRCPPFRSVYLSV